MPLVVSMRSLASRSVSNGSANRMRGSASVVTAGVTWSFGSVTGDTLRTLAVFSVRLG